MTIKVLKENVIKQLSNIKDDNVSIAGIAIERRKLLEILRLQTKPDTDILTIDYGNVSWEYEYQNRSDGSWEYKPYVFEPKPCIQISCDHTVLRFMNHPKVKGYEEPKIIPLNFVDSREYVKPKLTGIAIDTEELIRALSFVIHGVAKDDNRPVLACVLFESGNDTLALITADGFRLAVDKFAVKGIKEGKVLINRLDIPKLLTFLKSNVEGKGKRKYWLDTYMKTTKKTVQFLSERGMVEFDKQDGTYPNYSQLVPESGTHIQVVASDMLEATKAITTFAKDGSGIVRLQFSKYPDNLTLSARSEELGNSSVECLARVDRECKIAVNAKYLIDFLSTCKGNLIDIFITEPSSPMVCHNGIDQYEVIMPMFVQWGTEES